MPHQGILDQMAASLAVAPVIGFANVNSAAVDMQGYSGVAFLIPIGAIAATGTFDALVVESHDTNIQNGVNVANTNLVQVAAAGNTNLMRIDVWRPTRRYVFLRTIPATANVTMGAVALRYGRNGVLPLTLEAGGQYVRVQSN